MCRVKNVYVKKEMFELTFIRLCYFLKYLINPKSKGCLEKAKAIKRW